MTPRSRAGYLKGRYSAERRMGWIEADTTLETFGEIDGRARMAGLIETEVKSIPAYAALYARDRRAWLAGVRARLGGKP